MDVITNKKLTRIALLTALAVVFQSLRIFIPIPQFVSTFIIGSLVNAVLLVSVGTIGFWGGLFIAVVTPIVAFFQQMLPLPVFIVPVALGNLIYVTVFKIIVNMGKTWYGVVFGAIGKTLFLFVTFKWLLGFIMINPKMAEAIMFAMSWPQLVTALLGGLLAAIVIKRIRPII